MTVLVGVADCLGNIPTRLQEEGGGRNPLDWPLQVLPA